MHISDSILIDTGIAIATVIEKVISAIENGAAAPAVALPLDVQFFPDETDLKRAVHVHLMARIQNSNAHHLKWRGEGCCVGLVQLI